MAGRRLRFLTILVVLTGLFLLSGCGASDAVTTPAPTVVHSPTPKPLTGPSREAISPDPNFDFGYTVHITTKGFLPHWLVATCCQAITWQNLTGVTTSVVFDHLGVVSGPIPAGGTFTFTPKNVESIAYHSGTDTAAHAIVQVNQSTES
jgi:hypothetical protein